MRRQRIDRRPDARWRDLFPADPWNHSALLIVGISRSRDGPRTPLSASAPSIVPVKNCESKRSRSSGAVRLASAYKLSTCTVRISPFLVIASIPRGSPGTATALATAEVSSTASRNDSRRDSLVSSAASSRDRQDVLITEDDTLPLKGEVSRTENNTSSPLNLLTGTKSRIFSYTGCRGHPCPGKRETHGGFHIQSRSSPRSRAEGLLSDEGCD